MHVVVNHLRFAEPLGDATREALQDGVRLVTEAGGLGGQVVQVDDRHLILVLQFRSADDADRVAREAGGPWMREHIVPLLADGTERSLGEVIASSSDTLDGRAVPILPSRDLHETLAFYERLGFELRGAPIERYRYLIIGRGTVELHFWESPDVDPLTTSAGCYVHVGDADALHAEWAAVGVRTDPATGSRLMPPWDTDYRLREFALVDPSGNLVRIGSPLPR